LIPLLLWAWVLSFKTTVRMSPTTKLLRKPNFVLLGWSL